MKKYIKATVCIVVIAAAITGLAFVMRYSYDRYIHNSYPLKYEKEIELAAEKYNVDKALIYGVIKTESDFDTNAESSAGAVGLMQIMPETFEWVQMYYSDNDYTFDDLYNYKVNIDYGTHILSILIDMYKNEDTAVCAYNAGIGRVNGWLEDPGYSDDGITLKNIPIAETDHYLEKVIMNKNIYNRLYFDQESKG